MADSLEQVKIELEDADVGPHNTERYMGESEIGFYPHTNYVVVYAPPPSRDKEIETEDGKVKLDLSQADSLDASLPLRGTVVAKGAWVNSYDLGDEVLIKRYTGIQIEVDGDTDYWILNIINGEVLGRFDTTQPAAEE